MGKRAKTIKIEPNQIYIDVEDFSEISNNPKILRELFNKIHDLGYKPKRGDVVIMKQFSGYRNNGILIYDGEKLRSLEFDIDDYGSVPKSMKVITEFPINYWEGIILHNKIVHFDITTLIPSLTVNNLYKFTEENDSNKKNNRVYIVFPFTDQTGKIYYITITDNITDEMLDKITPEIFLKILKNYPSDELNYFNYINENSFRSPLKQDNTLVIPLYNFEKYL